MISRGRPWVTITILGGMLAGFFGLAACGSSTNGICAGQCGPPYQLLVIFRPDTSRQVATTDMNRCAWKPFVVRVGRAYRFHGPKAAESPLRATVYTKSTVSHQNDRLLACLRRSSSVISAGYPD